MVESRWDQFYTIVDTAGLRKKSVIDEDVEYYGFVRAMRAIDRAEVVLLVIDSTIGLTDQDQRVAGMAAERGCAMVVVLNKWDLVEGPDAKAEVRERIEDRLKFVGYAPVIAISALSGKNVQRIWGAINEAHANYSKSISTSRLNNWLQDIREFGHTISKGKRILKLKYVTQTVYSPRSLRFSATIPIWSSPRLSAIWRTDCVPRLISPALQSISSLRRRINSQCRRFWASWPYCLLFRFCWAPFHGES